MKPGSPFLHMLGLAEQKLSQLQKQAAKVRLLCSADDNAAYDAVLRLEEQAEKAVLLIRQLPVYTGRPSAKADSEQVVLSSVPLRIGFTPEGWFRLVIPALLPIKEHGNVNYYRGILYPAMQRFFAEHPPVRFSPCVLIYRHVYVPERAERRVRDHDNIEVNMISDIVALYTMPDDNPHVCTHFYCSAQGDSDRTEVYVIPAQDLPKWLNTMPWTMTEPRNPDEIC